MKKLKLSLANMHGAEILTREQLKKVIGGDYGSGSDDKCNCNSKDECSTNQNCFACPKGSAGKAGYCDKSLKSS